MTAIPGPENIKRVELKNGIVILIYENHASPAVVVRGHLHAGSLFDPADKPGVAFFTAEVIERGTESRSFQAIASETENVGASVGFGSGLHLASFSAKGLSEDLKLLLDILSDIIQHPTFPKSEIEKVRGEILTGIREREDSTQAMAQLTFRRLAFPNHPYGRDTLGTFASVSNIKRMDLKKFYQDYYRPESLQLAVVGDVQTEQVVTLIKRFFSQWKLKGLPPSYVIPPAKPLQKMQRKQVRMKNKTQSDIVIGAPALPRTHPDFLAAEVADVILGEFGMMGRLGDNVRDRLGLAYNARSQLVATPGPGPWMAYAGVNPQNVETAVEAMLFEMKRMKAEPVAANELDDVKDYMTGSQPLRLESNDGIAAALLDMEFYNLGLDYLQRHPALVRAITAEQVQSAAQKYLPTENYALVVAGP